MGRGGGKGLVEHCGPDLLLLSPAAHEVVGAAGRRLTGFHCVPADATGVDVAVQFCLDTQPGGDADDDGGLIMLCADIPGRMAQALLFALRRAAARARLLFVCMTEVGADVATGAGAAMTHACLNWGSRVVQQAEELGPLGGAVTLRRHGRTSTYQMLGLSARLRAIPARLSAPPEVLCHFHAGGVAVHALAQQEGDAEVEIVTARIRYAVERSGGGFTVETRCLAQARLRTWHGPRDCRRGGAVLPSARATGRCRRARTHARIAERGGDGPGYLVQVWDDLAWRESVVLAAPRGAIPVVEGLRKVAEHLGIYRSWL